MTKLFDLKLEGFDELMKTFDRLPDNLQKKALRPALRAGAKVIQKAAKAKSPRLSGKNRKFIKVKSLKKSRRGIGLAIQTGTREQLNIPRDERGYYPMVIEYGSKNVKKQPFMRPALEQNRETATKAIAKELKVRIEKIFARRGRRR